MKCASLLITNFIHYNIQESNIFIIISRFCSVNIPWKQTLKKFFHKEFELYYIESICTELQSFAHLSRFWIWSFPDPGKVKKDPSPEMIPAWARASGMFRFLPEALIHSMPWKYIS